MSPHQRAHLSDPCPYSTRQSHTGSRRGAHTWRVFIEEDTPFLRPQRGQLGVTVTALGFLTRLWLPSPRPRSEGRGLRPTRSAGLGWLEEGTSLHTCRWFPVWESVQKLLALPPSPGPGAQREPRFP